MNKIGLALSGGGFRASAVSPGPRPFSPRRRRFAPGEPHHLGVRRQHFRRPPGAQLGPLQRLAQRVRRRGGRVSLVCPARCPQSDHPPLSLDAPAAWAASASGPARIAS